MPDVRVVGTREEIELIARSLGSSARMSRRRDGGTAGYFEVRAPKVICLDCETTGLDPEKDEILTLSIVDWSGNTLHNGKYKPSHKMEWPEAARINGIWPKDVVNCPLFSDDREKIREIVCSADEIIAYNAEFDLSFLESAGVMLAPSARVTDTMLDYADEMQEWDDYHQGWKWHKLTAAATHVGYEWTGRAHGSLADALACLAVQKWVERKRHERAS